MTSFGINGNREWPLEFHLKLESPLKGKEGGIKNMIIQGNFQGIPELIKENSWALRIWSTNR